MQDIHSAPVPQGELAQQTIAMPKDTNANGDIFGGWLLSQMDMAGAITAADVAGGRFARSRWRSPEYHESYYACFIQDADGNHFEGLTCVKS